MASATPSENPQTGDVAPTTFDHDHAKEVNKQATDTTKHLGKLMRNPDSDTALLAKALSEDKKGKKTKVEMIEVAHDDKAAFNTWMEKYMSIFTDPNDMEDPETIHGHLKAGTAILYMVEAEMQTDDNRTVRKQIGITLTVINNKVPDSAYVPYAGIDKEFRGIGSYSRALQHNELALSQRGKEVVMIDCEDATRLEGFRESYEGLTDEQIAQRCNERLHFWMLNGYVFVDNDSSVQYCRPNSDDPQEIQAYDLLGIRILGDDSQYEQYFRKDEEGTKTHITKEGYRAMYLALHTLDQYSDLDETGLRAAFPAIDKFLTELDASPKTEFPLYKDVLAKQ